MRFQKRMELLAGYDKNFRLGAGHGLDLATPGARHFGQSKQFTGETKPEDDGLSDRRHGKNLYVHGHL